MGKLQSLYLLNCRKKLTPCTMRVNSEISDANGKQFL